MASPDQTELQQRTGYSMDQSGDYVNNEKGFDGPPPQAQGDYPPQGNPVQQSYEASQYQGQPHVVGPNEYVDQHGHVVRRKVRGRKFACCLAVCWCITWPCHGPCCGGL